jgi:cyclohexanone monooxygenase
MSGSTAEETVAASLPHPDHAAMRDKYRQERDKRMRPDARGQYRFLDDEEDPLLADPFAESVAEREPRTIETDVAILGAGMSCLIASAHLLRQGVEDFVILDKAADFGGTWYWNRYPGVRCDVEAYIYLPFLEELGYMPSEKYTAGTEIWQYQRSVAQHFDLYRRALFQTRVTGARWDEAKKRWQISTNRGDRISARFVVSGLGQQMHRPKLPGIPGIEEFEGKTFHTSRWDYDYTGGDARGDLTGLRDKKVALIGTGATGIQVMPLIAKDAGHLYVVQRTPSAVDSRDNAPTDAAWFEALPKGWQRERMVNFDAILAGLTQAESQVADQWTVIWGFPKLPADSTSPEERAAFIRDYDFAQMDRIRDRIAEIVKDPKTAEALKPYYSVRCKRPTFNDEYYPSFNRPNVTLLDTDGKGVERVTKDAIYVAGERYPVDCIIYATGFDSFVSPARAGGFDFVGRNGASLSERWASGAVTVHGMYSHGFPNLFVIGGGRQGATTINVPLNIDNQSAHAAGVIASLLNDGKVAFEITPEAEQRWADVLASHARYNWDAIRECTPSIYNGEGDLQSMPPLFASGFGGGFLKFIDMLEEWRRSELARDALVETAPQP